MRNSNLTTSEKKEMYNRIMEATSQIVIKKIIENDTDFDINEIIEEGWKEALFAGALGLTSIFITPYTASAKNINT